MRTASLGLCLLLLSCSRGDGGAPTATHLPGDTPPPDPDKAERVEAAPAAPMPDITIAKACAAAREANRSGCEWATRFPPQFHEGNNCEANLEKWLEPGARNRDSTRAMVNCWALPCRQAIDCMLASRKTATGEPRQCGDPGTQPVHVDASIWANRRGAAITKFSQANTSTREPIEVCGIRGEIEWMMRATCDDGSKPYPTPSSVNDGRDSWVEHGGRCGSVLDRYTVRCPEATYAVHIDRYICPPAP